MGDEDRIREKLREVVDPEIGYDIISLGLVYSIEVDGKRARIEMTLTTPFCPYGPMLVDEVRKKAEELGYEAEVDVVFDPPWSVEMVDGRIRDELGL